MNFRINSFARTSVDVIINGGDYNLINTCECDPDQYLNALNLPDQISVEYENDKYSIIVYTSCNSFDEVTCIADGPEPLTKVNANGLESNKMINAFLAGMAARFGRTIVVDWNGKEKIYHQP